MSEITYPFGRCLFDADFPASRQTGLAKQLRSAAMRLFRRLAIAKNTLAEKGILFRTRYLYAICRIDFAPFLQAICGKKLPDFQPIIHPVIMKKILNPLTCLAMLALLALVTTGCPVGTSYPFCQANQVEKVDNRLLGTWKSVSDSADILEVKISQEDDVTYNVEVLAQSEMYMADDTRFYSWSTKLDGHSFLFSQGLDSGSTEYYLYEYGFEGKKLVIHDVSLLVGGMDAVTSTEAFRAEVSASLKKPDCLTARFEYVKE